MEKEILFNQKKKRGVKGIRIKLVMSGRTVKQYLVFRLMLKNGISSEWNEISRSEVLSDKITMPKCENILINVGLDRQEIERVKKAMKQIFKEMEAGKCDPLIMDAEENIFYIYEELGQEILQAMKRNAEGIEMKGESVYIKIEQFDGMVEKFKNLGYSKKKVLTSLAFDELLKPDKRGHHSIAHRFVSGVAKSYEIKIEKTYLKLAEEERRGDKACV